jgi:hypothetical protein
VEWIGLERISEAIRTSRKGKENLGAELEQLINAYFEIEFSRQERMIQAVSSEESPLNKDSALLQPIKSRFLGVILKLCPVDFLPPYECLHFVRTEYFELPKVREIKRNRW